MSETWLQHYVNQLYQAQEQQVQGAEKRRLTLLCDELWSFVGDKENKQWIWLAMDQGSKRIVGVHVGRRDEQGPKDYGDHCLESTVNVRCATRISGRLMTDVPLR